MDELLDVLMTFAVDQVTKHGEFYPFGGVTTAAGEYELVAAATEDDNPASVDLLTLLEKGLRGHADSGAKAIAIAADVRVADPGGRTTDAIRVHVEHAEGDSVDVFMPYEKKRLRGAEFGEIFASPADRLIFT